MFGVSIPEILLVCVVILIVLGPERLPEATRKVAQILGQFRRQADAVRRDLYNSMYIPGEDIKEDYNQIKDNLRAVKDEVSSLIPNIPEELMTCEDKARLAEQQARESEEEAESDVTENSEATVADNSLNQDPKEEIGG